ncbi:hypothetical protein P3T76_009101 [Phytophthora citrophthora]|uniref:Necrosis inducing-like protein NPP1 type n=1 Tax=Phytophthora citrophthora TaxID=4793 RepID=A0AAD9GIB3_9STRA|nr:hypothetical protein P3T76_009101 [Phytophthora citrophthora]
MEAPAYVHLRLQHVPQAFDLGKPYLTFSSVDGENQDLIMWEQLTDAARTALNDEKSFGEAEIPFSEEYYETHLDKAWPL